MADPVSLLREYNINKKEIIERDDLIIFGKLSWPKDVKTNYLMWSSMKKGKKGSNEKMNDEKEYYTLESLLYFLKNKDLLHPDYVRKADEANIPVVRRPVRKEVLAYLNGDKPKSDSIDKTAPVAKPTQVKRTHENDEKETAVKKTRVEK